MPKALSQCPKVGAFYRSRRSRKDRIPGMTGFRGDRTLRMIRVPLQHLHAVERN